MPDQNEITEYQKKIASLSVPDLKDILSHINKDKVPWKYDMVKAEIEARETGKPSAPVKFDEPKPEKIEKVKEEKLAPEAPPAAKPAFQLRKSKIAADQPAPKPIPPEPPKPEKKAEKVEEQPLKTEKEPEPKKQVEPKQVEKPKKVPEPSGQTAASAMDYAMLGSAIVFLILAVYIVAIPFVSLPGSGIVKVILGKIPIF